MSSGFGLGRVARQMAGVERGRARATIAILSTVILVGGCGGAVATPTSTAQATNSASPGLTASPQSTASPLITPAATDQLGPDGFPVAMGRFQLIDPASDGGQAAGAAIDDFGFDLLRRLDAKGNLCASPASIALALAMVRAGARGGTATEMDKVLRSFGSDTQAAEVVALMQTLQTDTYSDPFPQGDPNASPDPSGQAPLVELEVSNAVFSQKGMTLEQAYLDALNSRFAAGVGLLDFKADLEGARQTINRWASARTRGRIPEILKPGDLIPSTRIALANAIYLKAAWDSPFDTSDTRSLAFATASGPKVTVPTMTASKWLRYASGPGWRAVDLPYATDRMSMTIIVPDKMGSFVAGLSASSLNAITSQEHTYAVDLTLPRFSVDSRFDASEVLAAMGMPTLFTDRADLSGITRDEGLFIYRVVHEANIDVVEQGTTAAAVTVAIGATTGGGDFTPPPHTTFHVDKPFLYFIRDQASGTVLFMGRIDDPSAVS